MTEDFGYTSEIEFDSPDLASVSEFASLLDSMYQSYGKLELLESYKGSLPDYYPTLTSLSEEFQIKAISYGSPLVVDVQGSLSIVADLILLLETAAKIREYLGMKYDVYVTRKELKKMLMETRDKNLIGKLEDLAKRKRRQSVDDLLDFLGPQIRDMVNVRLLYRRSKSKK